MAKDTGWEWLYAAHRYASIALHAGLGSRARLAQHMEARELMAMLYFSYSGTVIAVRGVAEALFPEVDAQTKWNSFVFLHKGLVDEDAAEP